ncbi:MAG: hypothetical protein ABWY05_07660 [Noviherbaspirillum sp.]
MNDNDDHQFSTGALLKTMAVAALLAAAVSACNKSLDKPTIPQPPKPQTMAPGPAEITRAIFNAHPGKTEFYRDGERARGGLVIRT